jgi:hypothetical protein
MITSFFFIHPLGGEHVKEVHEVERFLKEKVHLIEKMSQFTDIRKNPQIKLNLVEELLSEGLETSRCAVAAETGP